jgi:hypothetical protein
MFPILYEINTRSWLRELSDDHGRPITLDNVPEQQFEQWRRFGFTHIWLMGAWSTGPLARAQALGHLSLRQSYSEALPDWGEADVVGSPYAIADYHISEKLGGDEALGQFRAKLHRHGMKLVLDFVPNHLGVDHSWLSLQPEVFVQSPIQAPETFAQQASTGTFWLAHGKDPYFAAWTDTVQLDYRRASTQAAMIQLLHSLAERCDGLRCDMAMLLLNDVFIKTWARFPTDSAATPAEFWEGAIASIKSRHRGFLFLAEAYWGLEPRLLALGFDYTYDKTLYDRVVCRDGGGVQQHLLESPPELLSKSAHFLENHDEPRIASILSLAEQRAAALLVLGLPGMRFLHQGQLTGARRRVSVQLGRCIREPTQAEVEKMYDQLLTTLPGTAAGKGPGELLRPRAAWPENPSAQNFIVVQWQTDPLEFDLVVVNLAPHRSQCYVWLRVGDLAAHKWLMKDLLGDEHYERSGQELGDRGLYLDLPAHGAQLFHFERACEKTFD